MVATTSSFLRLLGFAENRADAVGHPTKHTNCCFDWLLWILFFPITNSSCGSAPIGAVSALTGKKQAGRERICQINSMFNHYKIPSGDEMPQHLPSRFPLIQFLGITWLRFWGHVSIPGGWKSPRSNQQQCCVRGVWTGGHLSGSFTYQRV